MANLAALRAAVCSLSAKNLRGGGGVDIRPPAVRGLRWDNPYNPRRHRVGGDAIALGFSENISRTDRPIVTKLGIPNH